MTNLLNQYHGNAEAEVFCNAEIEIVFSESIELMDVYQVVEKAIINTGVNRNKPYLTDFCLNSIYEACQNGKFQTEKLGLTPEMYEAYIPAITKALAIAFPENSFSGSSSYQEFDGYEFYSHQFEYSNKKLHISSEILANGHGGYFCPKCGEWVGYYYDGQPTEIPSCKCDELLNPELAVKSDPIKIEYNLTF